MAIYELRTYTLIVGKMPEAIQYYHEQKWLPKFQDKLVGYFLGDVGALNQMVHLWKFADDADRRRHWGTVYADSDFQEFAKRIRPLILTQENKLLTAAPWSPQP
ncbi:MAG: NIPSNAP family protein [Alphaproteobacteria bacterium]|nr:NIPSNAP family protein [Alphaproteobacteria bacterium]